jgi:hypothetical protein
MARLDARRIKFVRNLPLEVRAKVLYEFLKKGTSTRNIEKQIDLLAEEDGWQAWSVIHFYGFDGSSKGRYPNLVLKKLKEDLSKFDENELEEFHLDHLGPTELPLDIAMNENDGKDVFRVIKTRQGQHKLRKLLLQNYHSKCALCNISHPKLLVTSHIKPWSKSSIQERMDPCNSILLCKLHDGLFENGFISLTDDLEVLFSPDFDFENQMISKNLTFKEPVRDKPSPIFLSVHRKLHGFE